MVDKIESTYAMHVMLMTQSRPCTLQMGALITEEEATHNYGGYKHQPVSHIIYGCIA